MIFRIILLILTSFLFACRGTGEHKPTTQPTKMELRQVAGKFQLYKNGEPYYIKGAGLEFGSIETLATHGGNSFRTWRTDNGKQSGIEVLDAAYANGLTVTMGLDIARERHGFDYDDPDAVAKQFEEIKAEVLAYKDHPSLIIWGIGNELNLHATNPKVWDAVNDISKMIHEVDPYHLTTTSLAGISKELVVDINERCSDLDLLSIQMYADIVNLPKYLDETGWEGAYMVTEWGATGHWEIATTEWDAPIENNSSMKADFYQKRHAIAIASDSAQCVGSYVFLWGQKQERTPTWYGIFLESGEETESVDAMHYIWNQDWPANRTPRVDSVLLQGKTAYENIKLSTGSRQAAIAYITDPEADSISYRWEIKPESTDLKDGGDAESVPPSLPGLIEKSSGREIEFLTPAEPGAYRLFVYAFDGKGHAAHANIPFWVSE